MFNQTHLKIQVILPGETGTGVNLQQPGPQSLVDEHVVAEQLETARLGHHLLVDHLQGRDR